VRKEKGGKGKEKSGGNERRREGTGREERGRKAKDGIMVTFLNLQF